MADTEKLEIVSGVIVYGQEFCEGDLIECSPQTAVDLIHKSKVARKSKHTSKKHVRLLNPYAGDKLPEPTEAADATE
jgi:hypothetical protein